MQVVFHHVLPLALPGILTGTIIGMARALGETAPLLMIGMRAFVATPPGGFTEPATVLPVQIFLWSDEVGRGFVEKTCAAIIVLLLFLLAMNGVAIYLRNRFEKTLVMTIRRQRSRRPADAPADAQDDGARRHRLLRRQAGDRRRLDRHPAARMSPPSSARRAAASRPSCARSTG